MGETGSADDLPAGVRAFVDAAVSHLGPTLRAAVLFGSGAEGRLRATSDVNLLLVLRTFDVERIDNLREPLRLAELGARLAPMFVLDSELPAAASAFAVKFMDIGDKFLDKDGKLPKEIMPDALHPNTKGYGIWAEAIKPAVEEMMAGK